MSLTDEQLREIETFALAKYKELDYTHGINHAERSVKLAELLAKQERADRLICKLSVLLHQYHPEEAWKVDEFLRKLGVDDELRKQIVHCVECVELNTIHKAKTIEAMVVFDADKLQTLGPFGLIREICYRTGTKKIDFHTAANEARELQEAVYKQLQTQTAKKLTKPIHNFTRQLFEYFEQWDKVELSSVLD